MSQLREEYQRKTENAMFSKNIRSDLMDEEDLADLLADQRLAQLLASAGNPGQVVTNFDTLAEIPESNVMDIDEVKEDFRKMTSEIAEVVREALVLAASGKRLATDNTWNPLLTYDRAGKCPSCGEHFPLNGISNNKDLVKKVRSEFKNIQSNLPVSWVRDNRDNRLFQYSSEEIKSVIIGGQVEKKKEIRLNWDLFRSALSASGLKFEQKEGPMKRKEMLALCEVDEEWGKVAAGLILCSKRSLCCPNKGCHEDLWSKSLESNRAFHKISYEATRVILEETIGSPTARAALAIDATVDGNPVKLKMGKMGGDGSRTARKLIAEAVLSATSVMGDIEISSNDSFDGKVSISQADSAKASKVYTTPNHNIVTSLTRLMQRIRPIEAFVRDGRNIADHQKWASNCAARVLHVIHQSGCLFKIEKTGSWTYSSGNTGNHATNLVRLNDEIQERVSRDFISTLSDGETSYNSLECMLSKETTPPLVCKPVDRSASDFKQGGFLTKAGQRKYPLVTQAPQYKAFNEHRFIPSEEAVTAVNNLQSTEWSVDHDMAEIAKKTIKNHITTEIISNFSVRKVWQIRRHYFSESNESPLLSKSGEPRTNAVKGGIFTSLEEAEKYLETPESKSETCSEKKAQQIRYKVWREQIHEVYFIDFKNNKPSVTFGQITSWLNTFEFIKRLQTNYPDMNFWHAWHFDWRGRIMPVSTMLSPQNDDFSRGIITFANSHALSESGRKWIGRVTAAMYRGRSLPTIFEGEERDTLAALIKKLDDRTYEVYDEVSSNELFHKMLRVIAADPEAHFASWGQGDVFRAKAEGLQRIALTREFVSILDQGENAVSRLPINLDASSSIYQHASALMLDSDMASKVNVLPNLSGKPSDVYVEVVENLKKEWSGNPFATFDFKVHYENSEGKKKSIPHTVPGLDDETAEELKKKVLIRNMAKKPVMTIGYGASTQNMVRALLTDNNEDKGKHGGFTAYHVGENWPKVAENYADMDSREYRRSITAHPSSVIGDICDRLEIPSHFHSLIAQKVISGFTKSIEEVLPGYKKMKKSLQDICDSHRKQNGDSGARLTWEVNDGCTITNVYFKDPKMDSIGTWSGTDKATGAVRNITRKQLDESSQEIIPMDNMLPVDFEALEGVVNTAAFERLWKHEQSRLSEISRILEESEIISESVNMDKLSIDFDNLAQELCVGDSFEDLMDFESKRDEDAAVIEIVKAVRNYAGHYNVYFSRHILSNEEDHKAARRGIAPNFIHSLDACHMRMVVNRLALSNSTTDFWSVHDAFGCHPNHIEDLRRIVNFTFSSVHNADGNGRGALSRLYHETTGNELEVGDMELGDIIKENDGELVSKYLIS